MLVGKIVKMKLRPAKWYFTTEAYNAFVSPVTNEVSDSYHNIIQLSLMCVIGEEITGTVLNKGSLNCWKIHWQHGGISYSHYYDRKDFSLVK